MIKVIFSEKNNINVTLHGYLTVTYTFTSELHKSPLAMHICLLLLSRYIIIT